MILLLAYGSDDGKGAAARFARRVRRPSRRVFRRSAARCRVPSPVPAPGRSAAEALEKRRRGGPAARRSPSSSTATTTRYRHRERREPSRVPPCGRRLNRIGDEVDDRAPDLVRDRPASKAGASATVGLQRDALRFADRSQLLDVTRTSSFAVRPARERSTPRRPRSARRAAAFRRCGARRRWKPASCAVSLVALGKFAVGSGQAPVSSSTSSAASGVRRSCASA